MPQSLPNAGPSPTARWAGGTSHGARPRSRHPSPTPRSSCPDRDPCQRKDRHCSPECSTWFPHAPASAIHPRNRHAGHTRGTRYSRPASSRRNIGGPASASLRWRRRGSGRGRSRIDAGRSTALRRRRLRI